MAGTRPAVEDASLAAGDKGRTVEDMDPPRRDQGLRPPWLQRWGTGAPTDVDVAAGQQGAGGASQCEAPAEWDGGEEEGVCAGDRDGGGVRRRQREKRRVQRRGD